MAFEEFEPQFPLKHVATMTVTKAGRLGISAKTYDEYFENKKYAILYFDRASKKIGIKPSDWARNAYELYKSKRGDIQIAGTAFMKHFDIPFPQKAKKYTVKWNNTERIIEADL